MLKFMNKIPAGTFLIPLFIGAIFNTLWPTLLKDGGMTQIFLGGQNVAFIIALLTFIAGISIDLKSILSIIRYHGVLLLTKLAIAMIISLLYIQFFGQGGIFGISAIALITALVSVNPALYISLASEYGKPDDVSAFSLYAIIVIPATPMFVYSITSGGSIDWSPIISSLIPLLLGIFLGNLEPGFRPMYKPGMAMMLPILGWNLGQGINIVEAAESGLSGVLLLIIFYSVMSIIVLVDKYLLKQSGVIAMSINSLGGSSASFPAIVAVSYPAVSPYVSSATAQLITTALLSLIITPILVKLLAGKGESKSDQSA